MTCDRCGDSDFPVLTTTNGALCRDCQRWVYGHRYRPKATPDNRHPKDVVVRGLSDEALRLEQQAWPPKT